MLFQGVARSRQEQHAGHQDAERNRSQKQNAGQSERADEDVGHARRSRRRFDELNDDRLRLPLRGSEKEKGKRQR